MNSAEKPNLCYRRCGWMRSSSNNVQCSWQLTVPLLLLVAQLPHTSTPRSLSALWSSQLCVDAVPGKTSSLPQMAWQCSSELRHIFHYLITGKQPIHFFFYQTLLVMFLQNLAVRILQIFSILSVYIENPGITDHFVRDKEVLEERWCAVGLQTQSPSSKSTGETNSASFISL